MATRTTTIGADWTQASASLLGGPPSDYDGFESFNNQFHMLTPPDQVQVFCLLWRGPSGIHEADLLARLKRDDPARWRARRSAVPTLERLRRSLERERASHRVFSGDGYWTVARKLKPAIWADLPEPSDACAPPWVPPR